MVDEALTRTDADAPGPTGQVIFVLLWVVIALIPFPHATTIMEGCYYLAMALTLGEIVRHRDVGWLRTPFFLPVAMFSAWAFFGLFFAIDLKTSLHDFRTNLLEYIALYLALVRVVDSRKRFLAIVWVLVISCSLASLIELYRFYVAGGHSLSERFILSDSEYPVGEFGFKMFYAAILALALLRRRRLTGGELAGALACLVALLTTVVMVQTRAILLAAPFACLALFWRQKRILWVAVILTLTVGLAVLLHFRQQDTTTRNGYIARLTINYISLLVVKDHPLTGIGFGISTYGDSKFIDHQAYMARVPKLFRKPDEPISNPHDMWLDVAVRTGLVGLVLFAALIFTAFREGWAVATLGGDEEIRMFGGTIVALLISFCIYGLFQPVFLGHLDMLLCLGLALLTCVSRWPPDPDASVWLG